MSSGPWAELAFVAVNGQSFPSEREQVSDLGLPARVPLGGNPKNRWPLEEVEHHVLGWVVQCPLSMVTSMTLLWGEASLFWGEFGPPPNSHIEILTAGVQKVTVFGDRLFQR